MIVFKTIFFIQLFVQAFIFNTVARKVEDYNFYIITDKQIMRVNFLYNNRYQIMRVNFLYNNS